MIANMTWEQFGIIAGVVIWGGMALVCFLRLLKRQLATLAWHVRKAPVQTALAIAAVGICTVYAQKPTRYAVEFEVPAPYAPIEPMSCETGKVYRLPGAEVERAWIRGWRASEQSRLYDPGMLFFDIARPGETVRMSAIVE